MIVAAGAGDRQAEKATGECVDPIGQRFGFGLCLCFGIAAIRNIGRTEGEETGGGRLAISIEQVAGDLVGNELIVGHVRIESPHHPIAIAPCVGQCPVFKAAVDIAVAGDVEPVAGPTFAVLL